MNENWFDIATPDGTMNTFTACPDEGGPFPTVLFYMDAFGLREEIYAMVRRLASAGYFVVAPNLTTGGRGSSRPTRRRPAWHACSR